MKFVGIEEPFACPCASFIDKVSVLLSIVCAGEPIQDPVTERVGFIGAQLVHDFASTLDRVTELSDMSVVCSPCMDRIYLQLKNLNRNPQIDPQITSDFLQLRQRAPFEWIQAPLILALILSRKPTADRSGERLDLASLLSRVWMPDSYDLTLSST